MVAVGHWRPATIRDNTMFTRGPQITLQSYNQRICSGQVHRPQTICFSVRNTYVLQYYTIVGSKHFLRVFYIYIYINSLQ